MTTEKMAGFDIAELTSGEEATHKVGVVFDEDGEDVSGFIIVGKNSKQYQDISKKVRAKNIQQASKRKKDIDAATDEGSNYIVEKTTSNEHLIACAVVTNWFGFVSGGKEVEFNAETVSVMFEKKPQWRARVLAALEVDANFMTV